jgi:hypothetical protein
MWSSLAKIGGVEVPRPGDKLPNLFCSRRKSLAPEGIV